MIDALAATGLDGTQLGVLIGGGVLMLVGAAGIVYANILRRRGR